MVDVVWVTGPLLDVLLELSADADPKPITVSLAVTPAGELDAAESDGVALSSLGGEVPVFSDFYFPAAGDAVNKVFGIDLGTPVGQIQGRFLSHPMGEPDVTTRDDLASRMLVGVPPWDRSSVAAFDRSGRKLRLDVVAASAPDVRLED
ncbi:MAG: hypothetical protein ABEJ27_07545 [Halodesulfurarchaeum sp.]